jgi:hypothetical protein
VIQKAAQGSLFPGFGVKLIDFTTSRAKKFTRQGFSMGPAVLPPNKTLTLHVPGEFCWNLL